jgi:hypothetical protein
MTLETRPRHILSLVYKSPGDEAVAVTDSFIFVDGALYSWEIKSFTPDPPETPRISTEYAGQR